MGRPSAALRHLGAALVSIAGTALVVGLVLGMNGAGPSKDDAVGENAVSFEIPPPPKKKPKPQRRKKPKPKKRSRTPPPAPAVGASLAGLDLGLEAFMVGGADEADALLGSLEDVVMTSESVDELPRPQRQVPPEYPERARRQGLSGSVTLSLLVGVDGVVRDVKVLEASPAGVFDQPATAAVRQWRFQPATYEGRPVAIRVTQTLRFGFE